MEVHSKLEGLKKLKLKAENLFYNDEKALDEIKKLTKVYLKQIFPFVSEYRYEIDNIKFRPPYSIGDSNFSSYRTSWDSGKQKLINSISTRIHEYELILNEKIDEEPKVIVQEKIVEVENKDKINELTRRLSKKTLFDRLKLGVILTIIGGAFGLGSFLGYYKFDRDKMNLVEENKMLIDSITKIHSASKSKPISDSEQSIEEVGIDNEKN